MSDPDTMLDHCEIHRHLLSTWEKDFIDSISDVLANGWDLSASQEDKLTQIFKQVLEGIP